MPRRTRSDYVVAACWEFIIPGKGMDIPNIGALSLPAVIDRCVHRDLASAPSFRDFQRAVRAEVFAEAGRMASSIRGLWMFPAPFMSILMDGCVAKARDISEGCRYNNFGFHGTGLSTAVDSLAAIRRYVFEERSLTVAELVSAVDEDFAGRSRSWPVRPEPLRPHPRSPLGREVLHLPAPRAGINGGPLTMEFHSTLFRDAESQSKVADLVRLFVARVGHQMQLNAVNRDALLEAQRHPELHGDSHRPGLGLPGLRCLSKGLPPRGMRGPRPLHEDLPAGPRAQGRRGRRGRLPGQAPARARRSR